MDEKKLFDKVNCFVYVEFGRPSLSADLNRSQQISGSNDVRNSSDSPHGCNVLRGGGSVCEGRGGCAPAFLVGVFYKFQ